MGLLGWFRKGQRPAVRGSQQDIFELVERTHPAQEVVDEVRKLLAQSTGLATARGEWGRTPLHVVARVYSGIVAVAEALIEHGADVNAVDDGGETPLFIPTESPEMMELLISHGARVDTKNNSGQTPLEYSLSMGLESSARVLVAHGAKSSEPPWTPLPEGVVQVENYGGYGDGSPLLVVAEPDITALQTLFEQPDLHPPLRMAKLSSERYWMNQSREYIRHCTVMAYLAHPDPRVRIAALPFIEEYRSDVAGRLCDLLAAPEAEVRLAVADHVWTIARDTDGNACAASVFSTLEEIAQGDFYSPTVDAGQARAALDLLRHSQPPGAPALVQR